MSYNSSTHYSVKYPSDSVEQLPNQSVSERFEEAGVGGERFIPVEYVDGSKKPTENGWQSRQYPAELLDNPIGVVCGDGLVVVDDDSHKPGVESPEQLDELPETFTVNTMHGGSHHYYRVVGEQPQSRQTSWGDIQSAGDMVVAAGTEFSHEECNDCEQSGVSQYTVLNDVPIAAVNPEDYPEIFGIQTGVEAEDGTTGESNPTRDVDVDARLTFAVDHDEKFSRLWEWGKQGQSTSDNSSRETALAEKLVFYLGDETAVIEVLNGLSLPKWGSRGEYYRESVMAAARNYAGDGFDPEQSNSGSGGVCRDTAIQVSIGVLDGLMHKPIGRFQTSDVTESDKVDESDRHVRRILDSLEEAGYIRYERSGRSGYWVVDGFKSGDWDIPAAGDEFYQQFNTRTAVNQQRASWMNNHVE
jgi:hypothetical protein